MGRLVLPDGSFAQHSLTYHRLLLDTLAQIELWRRWLDLPPFSERFFQRCCAATAWLSSMVDPLSGDGPNLGSNDGAFCYQLHSQPYRDFRGAYQERSPLGVLRSAPHECYSKLSVMGFRFGQRRSSKSLSDAED